MRAAITPSFAPSYEPVARALPEDPADSQAAEDQDHTDAEHREGRAAARAREESSHAGGDVAEEPAAGSTAAGSIIALERERGRSIREWAR
jgi:hypothetical protein